MHVRLFFFQQLKGYQCNETNVMHFSFNLLRIKGLNIFLALLAHPQEALNNGIWYITGV
jgi:hypothetical protein